MTFGSTNVALGSRSAPSRVEKVASSNQTGASSEAGSTSAILAVASSNEKFAFSEASDALVAVEAARKVRDAAFFAPKVTFVEIEARRIDEEASSTLIEASLIAPRATSLYRGRGRSRDGGLFRA